MIKVDLITGFLGSGKTTFLINYVNYLLGKGLKVGILENDHGAVNVDMMLLQDLEGENCTLEMVAGGCDIDCHRRRFKTKLIAMGMSGYDRVIIEPSGIFDVDEFFDALREEPLDRWYEIGNVISIVDINQSFDMSLHSKYLYASQIANAGRIVISKIDDNLLSNEEKLNEKLDYLVEKTNEIMQELKCEKRISKKFGMSCKKWQDFTNKDYEGILNSSYSVYDLVKVYSEDNDYESLYYMNYGFDKAALYSLSKEIFEDISCGNVFRIKGFASCTEAEDTVNKWLKLNATVDEISIDPINVGQEIIIVIGEKLDKENIDRIVSKWGQAPSA